MIDVRVEKGKVVQARLSESSGDAKIDAKVLKIAKEQWRFPLKVAGQFRCPLVVLDNEGAKPKTHAFEEAPPVPYDSYMIKNGLYGTGVMRVTIERGKITRHTLTKSTRVSYLDWKALDWIKKHWVPQKDFSGTVKIPLHFKLQIPEEELDRLDRLQAVSL
jgi:outer membrane biosynthesis protein TonB